MFKPDITDLVSRAMTGSDADWDYITANLSTHTDRQGVAWALTEGLADRNGNIRDLAGTILATSDEPLRQEHQAIVLRAMVGEQNHFARYWMSNALYKRGNRTPEVVTVWHAACNDDDNPASMFARTLRAA